MKSYYLIKVILICTSISLLLSVYSSLTNLTSIGKVVLNTGFVRNSIDASKENTRKESLKYILQWTSDSNVPFVYMGKGQEGFIDRNCTYTNCFVTSNKLYLRDYTEFDVIAFAGPELSVSHLYNIQKPKRRSPHQKYVFASIEAATNYPICSNKYEGFFNWTWTYKLDSEVHWGYVVIRDLQNNIVGPRKDMHWLKPDEMIPVSNEFKNKLKSKTKAAAWYVSNCVSVSERENFVRALQEELTNYPCEEHSCGVDVYGDCGPFSCSRDNEKECDKKIEQTYYFYLAFENAFNEDYVTEKLVRALNNDAVPIVYGGANYKRFLPDGAYLDAVELGVQKLARKMYDLINNPEEYAAYFKWRNHYSYHRTGDTVETNEYCRFCAILNEEKSLTDISVYENFKDWWNSPEAC